VLDPGRRDHRCHCTYRQRDVIDLGEALLVIHAMDLRPKYRAAYEAGKEQR
jgi:hypothetical protein